VRVSLLYNSDAGSVMSLDHIRRVFERHGHNLVSVVEPQEREQHLLGNAPELVVAAGGDGTVAHAARTLAHRGIPLAILPLGTANNIARSLGVQGSIDDLVSAWHTARRVPLDLGVADGAVVRQAFVEGVGAGLLPAALADMQTRSDGDELPVQQKVAGAMRTIGRVLSRLHPVDMTIVTDGTGTTGAFLLVEILNMSSIGPNLVFSADATPCDGFFHVVMAGEEHRDEIARYLREGPGRGDRTLSLPSTRARHVTLEGSGDVHLDDEVLRTSAGRPLSMEIDAGALQLLA
jgi:diacylglycerol kinase (ATP)